jgi:hypothetical protein
MKNMKPKKSGIVEALKKENKASLAEARRSLKEDYVNGGPKPGAKLSGSPMEPNLYLFQKWAYRVGKGWYGFDLSDIPNVWVFMLDTFLAWVELQCPDFEILQIKTKFGGLRFYINTHCNDVGVNEIVRAEIAKLEKLMFHKNLIFGNVRPPYRLKLMWRKTK